MFSPEILIPCVEFSAVAGSVKKSGKVISKKATRMDFLNRLCRSGKVSQIAVKNILLQLFGEKISSHIKIDLFARFSSVPGSSRGGFIWL
jgi:hypothetical protein